MVELKSQPLTQRHSRALEAFWAFRRGLGEDPVALRLAVARCKDEQARGVPVYFQSSLESLVDQEGHHREVFRAEQASLSGRARKGDALDKLIEAFLRERSDATVPQVHAHLELQVGTSALVEIDLEEGNFVFEREKGGLKNARIIGLKDRVRRVRKRIVAEG